MQLHCDWEFIFKSIQTTLDYLQASPKGRAWPENADKQWKILCPSSGIKVKAHSWLERTLEGWVSVTTSCCPGSA